MIKAIALDYGGYVTEADSPQSRRTRAYTRLAGMLREELSAGVPPPGSPAPSTIRLCQGHGHVRQTCAKAMRLLEGQGMLYRVPGLGYYGKGREC